MFIIFSALEHRDLMHPFTKTLQLVDPPPRHCPWTPLGVLIVVDSPTQCPLCISKFATADRPNSWYVFFAKIPLLLPLEGILLHYFNKLLCSFVENITVFWR